MKKIYTINKIPSFRFEMDVPSGLSSLFSSKGKAEIYLFGKWVGWNNIYPKNEPNYFDSIDRFFCFLNAPTFYGTSDLERLSTLNNSSLGEKMFKHLGGWIFNFYDCFPNSDTLIISHQEPSYNCYFKLIPIYEYNHHIKERFVDRYIYEYYSSTKSAYENEKKTITGREGLDLIALIRLSFLSMIYNYEKESSSEIRVFSGWYNHKDNLIDFCKIHHLI